MVLLCSWAETHGAQLRGGASPSPRFPVVEQELSTHLMYVPNCRSKKAGWKCSVPSAELGCSVPQADGYMAKRSMHLPADKQVEEF